jgi:hypothetical protein
MRLLDCHIDQSECLVAWIKCDQFLVYLEQIGKPFRANIGCILAIFIVFLATAETPRQGREPFNGALKSSF